MSWKGEKTMVPRYVVAAALLLLLGGTCVLCGCGPAGMVISAGTKLSSEDTITRKAEYEIGGRSIVVIPFRDERHTYYESSDGVDLATAVKGELIRTNAARNVRSDEPVRTSLAGKDLDSIGWAEVAKQAGAQLVLTGDIQRFTLKDPKAIGILRGTCKLNYFVYDAARGVVAYSVRGLEVYHPERGGGIPESEVDQEKLRSDLLSITALKVVQKFYTYKEKVGLPPSRY